MKSVVKILPVPGAGWRPTERQHRLKARIVNLAWNVLNRSTACGGE